MKGNGNGGQLSRNQKLVRGIDGIVAHLLSARAAVEADDLATVDTEIEAAANETAALAKALRS